MQNVWKPGKIYNKLFSKLGQQSFDNLMATFVGKNYFLQTFLFFFVILTKNVDLSWRFRSLQFQTLGDFRSKFFLQAAISRSFFVTEKFAEEK